MRLSLSVIKTEQAEDEINILENMLDKIPVPFLILTNANIYYCNQKALDFLGASQKEKLLSKPFLNLVHKDYQAQIFSIINSILYDSGNVKKILGRVSKSDGTSAETDFQFIPLIFKSRQYVIVTLQDATTAKQQDIIQQTILKILQAVNSTFSLEEICDYLYNTVAEIIPIKNFYVALYDKSKESITFPYFKDEFNAKPSNRKFRSGLTEYVIKTKTTLLLNSENIEGKIKDGMILPTNMPVKSWLGVPLFIQEDIAGVIVIKEYQRENFLNENVKEIFELVSYPISRVIERALIDETRKNFTHKLQELNNAKDKFFSIISHDLKSPFNSILGFTEILKEQHSVLNKDELEQIFDALYNSTRKTYNLLNNLLQYSRFQTGLVDFNPIELNLLDVVEENLILFEGTMLKKQIKLTNKIKNDLLIYSDKEMLNSILRNLINNAIKFTRSGGEIYLDSKIENDYVQISVKDNGVGMDNETCNNLFKMESKKSTLGTNKEEGTGFGLILVKEFVERNGGQIFVKSQLEKGSEFSFTLKLLN